MMKQTLLTFLLALPTMLWAETSDDFAVWSEVGVEKDITKQWGIGLETEYRAQDKARWGIGLNTSYKPCKYLKLGAFYSFLYSQKHGEREEHFRKDIPDAEHWNGYDIEHGFWYPRHRAGAEVTGTVKLWKWLRISLRERYQYTYRPTKTRQETKYRFDKFIDGETGEPIYQLKDENEDDIPDYPMDVEKERASEESHILRSRLKLELDKKGCRVSPFISTELHNDLADGMDLDKIRSAVGFSYKVSKHHEVSMSYILTCTIHDDEDSQASTRQRMHAFGVGYNYKF